MHFTALIYALSLSISFRVATSTPASHGVLPRQGSSDICDVNFSCPPYHGTCYSGNQTCGGTIPSGEIVYCDCRERCLKDGEPCQYSPVAVTGCVCL